MMSPQSRRTPSKRGRLPRIVPGPEDLAMAVFYIRGRKFTAAEFTKMLIAAEKAKKATNRHR